MAMNLRSPRRLDRCPAITYQELLDSDSKKVPEIFREQAEPDIGTQPIPIEHYLSPDFFHQSVEKMWLKTWQMACREEEIPNVGDYLLYELAGKSLIIVRSAADEIKALYNVCLHRGRQLVSAARGCRQEFKCSFHGFIWKNDGTFAENPIQWDFPHCPPGKMRLPEVSVGRWGGFVFVNFDRNAPALEGVLGIIPRHFERWDIASRYKAVHVGKVIRCNWLIAVEAFMEAHHSYATHPQILKATGDANAQHDIFSDHVTRMIVAKGISSPFLKDANISEDEILRCTVSRVGRSLRDVSTLPKSGRIVPEGSTARAYLGEMSREALASDTGLDCSSISDAELSDTINYNLFPNLQLYGGFLHNIVMRWRPNGLDHRSCLMELMILRPFHPNVARPSPTPLRMLAEEETWSDVEQLGPIGVAIDQDMGNMPFVQKGLEGMEGHFIELGRYTESRIRWQHRVLEKYISASST